MAPASGSTTTRARRLNGQRQPGNIALHVDCGGVNEVWNFYVRANAAGSRAPACNPKGAELVGEAGIGKPVVGRTGRRSAIAEGFAARE